jgi:hypothetical protein
MATEVVDLDGVQLVHSRRPCGIVGATVSMLKDHDADHAPCAPMLSVDAARQYQVPAASAGGTVAAPLAPLAIPFADVND